MEESNEEINKEGQIRFSLIIFGKKRKKQFFNC